MDQRLGRSLIRFVAAGLVLAAVLWLCQAPVDHVFAGWSHARNVATLVALTFIGGVIYGAMLLALFGFQWFKVFRISAP